jgi:hypothetical protein
MLLVMNSDISFRFSARASGVMADFSYLTLYNGFLDTVLKGYGEISGILPKGLYKLVVVLNDQTIDKYIRLDQDLKEFIEVKPSTSSALAEGLGNNHEYYSDRAKEYYFTPTTSRGNPLERDSIFIFFRYQDQVAFLKNNPEKESLGLNFRLLDENRKLICLLTERYIKEDKTEFGWLAFHIKLLPGNYYLYYGGKKSHHNRNTKSDIPAREIPIRVFYNWQTQCFMTFGKGPIFKSLFVSMRSSDVAPDNYGLESGRELYDIEGILQKFNNGIYYLPPEVLNKLAYGKWHNPMLGLIAAYAYFKSNKRDQEELFRTVVRNLGRILGENTPEFTALQCLATEHFSDLKPIFMRYEEPCMFAAGMVAVMENRGDIVPPDSMAERIADKLFSDLVWTSYSPLSTFRVAGRPKRHTLNLPGFPFRTISTLQNILPADVSEMIAKNKGNKEEETDKGLAQRQKFSRPSFLSSWVANSLMGLVSYPQSELLTVPQLAAQLRVTVNMLDKIINEIIYSEWDLTNYFSRKKTDTDAELYSSLNIQRLRIILLNSTGSQLSMLDLEPVV